jgi:hypothetical protein
LRLKRKKKKLSMERARKRKEREKKNDSQNGSHEFNPTNGPNIFISERDFLVLTILPYKHQHNRWKDNCFKISTQKLCNQ